MRLHRLFGVDALTPRPCTLVMITVALDYLHTIGHRRMVFARQSRRRMEAFVQTSSSVQDQQVLPYHKY